MKPLHFYRDRNEKPGGMARPITTAELNRHEHSVPPPPREFTPSAHEVAGRAYAHFLKHGSRHGHDLEHWLHAEAELRQEHEFSRKRG